MSDQIIIVEDDAIIAVHLQAMLGNLGYEVVGMAATGEDAIVQVANLQPDLVLMDIELAGEMNGIQAAHTIRVQRGTPVVFLTAYADNERLQQAKMSEPYGYLVKPVQMRELQATLEMALYKHRMDELLRQSELRYRTVVSQALEGILLYDVQNRVILEANPAFQRLFDYTEEEFAQLTIEQVLSYEGEAAGDIIQQILAQKQMNVGERRYRRRDGSILYVEVNSSLLHYQGRDVICLVVHNITRRKRAEEALQHQLLMEEVVSTISASFINEEDLNATIRNALRSIGLFTDASYAFVYWLSENGIRATCLWNASDDTIDDHMPGARAVVSTHWVFEQLKNFRLLDVPRVVDLPKEAAYEKSMWMAQGIESLIAIPLVIEDRLIGFLGVASSIPEKLWVKDDFRLLTLIADVLVGAAQRRRAEEERSRSEEWFRTIYDESPIAIALLDEQGRCIDVNKSFKGLFGIDTRDIQDYSIYEDPLMTPEFRDALKAGQPIRSEVTYDFRLVTPCSRNGEGEPNIHDLEVLLTPLCLKDSMHGYLMHIQDITIRKRAEIELRRQALIFDNIYDAVILTDLQGLILAWNPAAERMFGYSADEVIGKSPDILHRPEDRPLLQNRILQGFYQDGRWHGEVVLVDKLGGQRVCEVTVVSCQDEKGQIVGTIGVNHDITERKRAEQAELEQRSLSEALRDTAAVLTSTINIDEVMDRILDNVGRVVPHDASNIVLIETEMIRIARVKDPEHLALAEVTQRLHLTLNDLPPLKRIVDTGKPLVISDTRQDPLWAARPTTAWIRSYVGAPIRVKGEIIGFLNLDSATPGFFNQVHAEQLQAFADQAAVAIQNAKMFITDPLTNVYNRRGLFELGQMELERTRRFGRPMSALFLDIDHFGDFNNTYGHIVGDLVLSNVAERCRSGVRSVDVVGRYGGEEFVILLLETAILDAALIAERLRTRIEMAQIPTEAGSLSVTISIGVAQLKEDMATLLDLIEQADYAMLSAKQLGRNRVVVHST